MALSASNARMLLRAHTMPSPELKNYLEATGDDHIEGRDVWITSAGLNPGAVLPGIPEAYRRDCLEGRALYTLGVLPHWRHLAFKEIFRNCGEVEKCPCIIDVASEDVFRWVIMSTADEATTAMENIEGMLLGGEKIRLCRALPPGDTFIFSEEYPLEKFLNWDLNSNSTRGNVPSRSPPPDTQNQIVPALAQPPTLQKEQVTPKYTLPDDDFVPQAVTWANIVLAARGTSRSVDLQPRNKPPRSAPRLRPVGQVPEIIRPAVVSEPLAEQMRVVFLLNLPDDATFADVSDGIKEGALHSMRFGFDENDGKKYAGIIFQYAKDAESFYQVMRKEYADSTPTRFPFTVEAARGEPFLCDDIIKIMAPPKCASRRLTIVKSKFFSNFREYDFRNLCEEKVSAENIQCIWLFNAGNATVVCTNVRSAVRLKKELDKLSAAAPEESNFYGLQVTYSKDPCVQEIHYITDMREGGNTWK